MKNLFNFIKNTFIFVIIVYFCNKNIQAQNIIVKTITPQNTQINVNGWAKKIKSILSTNDWKEDWQTQFTLHSNFTVGEKQVVEGGMQKLTVCKFTLELELKNWILNSTLHKETFMLTGTGMALQDAFGNAINKANDKQFSDFLSKSQTKIIAYYEKECKKIMENASKEEEKGNFEKAILLLSAIPDEGVSCSKDAEAMKEEALYAYQNAQCKQKLLEAKILAASQKYEEALQKLAQIPSETECQKNRDEMIDQIAKKYEAKTEFEQEKSWKETQKQTIDKLYQQQFLILEK